MVPAPTADLDLSYLAPLRLGSLPCGVVIPRGCREREAGPPFRDRGEIMSPLRRHDATNGSSPPSDSTLLCRHPTPASRLRQLRNAPSLSQLSQRRQVHPEPAAAGRRSVGDLVYPGVFNGWLPGSRSALRKSRPILPRRCPLALVLFESLSLCLLYACYKGFQSSNGRT